MSAAREAEVAEVWRDSTRVGTITRLPHGSVFAYAPDFYATHSREPGGLAVHLPYAQQKVETHGVNLHSYFANLLPEGIRLQALVRRTKSSQDDLFSLLIAAGPDTVGDVSVVAQGERPRPTETAPGPWKPETLLFSELFSESLASASEPIVPGVQEKVSASQLSLPLRPAGRSAAILKLNPPNQARLVENEAFFMGMAKACGLDVAPVRLVNDREGNPGLLVERFDRVWRKDEKRLVRIHQEDACQFLDRYPADKYRLSCREIAEAIRELCVAPVPEMAKFLKLIAFSYLIGNGDLHAKNVSLLADGPGGGFRLSPGYDLLSTLPYGDRRMALKFEGRDDNLRRRDFIAFGERFGVRGAAVEAMLDRLCADALPWVGRVGEIGLDARKTSSLQRTMRKRLVDLG